MGLMEKLLEKVPQHMRKKRLNAKDDGKLTAIHYATRYNHYQMIDYLIKNGASEYERIICGGLTTKDT